MLSINTNLSSLIAQSSLKNSSLNLNQAVERMSTGYKINHAKDNAANYSIATNMFTKIGSYQVAEENVMQALDLLNTASESLLEIESYAKRLRNIAMQAKSTSYETKTAAVMNLEAQALVKELNKVYKSANYNSISLFSDPNSLSFDSMPKAGESGFIDETNINIKSEYNGFIDNPVTYSQAEVEAMSSIDDFDLSVSKKYKITSAEDLAKLAEIVNSGTSTQNGIFVLSCDIDLKDWCDANGNWIPIGNTTYPFKGTFDGNGHTISNLKIDNETADYQGLFGYEGQFANIKNVALKNVQVKGKNHVGGLTGGGRYSPINNCFVTGIIRAIGGSVGGLAGSSGSVKNSYSTCDVSSTGGDYIGGLIGFTNGNIEQSFATGDVILNNSYGGGLAGYAAKVINCYATGTVTQTNGSRCGGLVGTCSNIVNCYATGDVNAGGWCGGLVGEGSNIENSFATGNVQSSSYPVGGLLGIGGGIIKNCYAKGDVSALSKVGGLIGQYGGSSIYNCYSEGDVKGGGGTGGLIGCIYKASGTIDINNTRALGNVTSTSAKSGSFIGFISITSDNTNFGKVNILNSQCVAQSLEMIGACTKNDTIIDYDMSLMLAGINGISNQQRQIGFHIGSNGDNYSLMVIETGVMFEISALDIDITSENALVTIDDFIDKLSFKQAEIGSAQNRLESVLDEISIQYDNLVSSRSTIMDADIGEVSATFIQQQILQQAASTLLSTVNQTPSIALQLL